MMTIQHADSTAQSKALFLDRDGTINIDYGYVYQPEKFDFIDGIFDVCKTAQQLGYLIIVITNQSGIERGYFSETDFEKITDYMRTQFEQNGVLITDVFYCPFLDSTHPDRKPNAGLIRRAQQKYHLNLSDCIMLGDSQRDILAGINAGVGTTVLFNPAEASNEKTGNTVSEKQPSYTITHLRELIKYL